MPYVSVANLSTMYIFIQGAELTFFKVSKVHVQSKVLVLDLSTALILKRGPSL